MGNCKITLWDLGPWQANEGSVNLLVELKAWSETGSNSFFCLQVESVLLLWKNEKIFDMQQTGSTSCFCLQVESVLLLWKNEKIFDMQQTGSTSCFCLQVESVPLLWKIENIWHATNRFHQLFLPAGWICTATVENWKYLTCNKQVPTVCFACRLNLYCYCGKLKIYLTCNKQVPTVFLPASWICTATVEKWKNIWHATNRFHQLFLPASWICTATVEKWKNIWHATNRFHQLFLPAGWICTATVENWKYLTCNKQVPPVVFACRLNLYCYCGKMKNIWHATNRFHQLFLPAGWICTATVENWKYLTCNKQVPPVVFACRLNLYCYCGKLKIFDMQQTGSTSLFCLQVESVLLLWKIENIWHATNRFQQFVLPAGWICTATVENWKYIWHATNRFHQFVLPAGWICTATVENWKYIWHATNRFQQFFLPPNWIWSAAHPLDLCEWKQLNIDVRDPIECCSDCLDWKIMLVENHVGYINHFLALMISNWNSSKWQCFTWLLVFKTKFSPQLWHALTPIRCPSAGPVRVEAARHIYVRDPIECCSCQLK